MLSAEIQRREALGVVSTYHTITNLPVMVIMGVVLFVKERKIIFNTMETIQARWLLMKNGDMH